VDGKTEDQLKTESSGILVTNFLISHKIKKLIKDNKKLRKQLVELDANGKSEKKFIVSSNSSVKSLTKKVTKKKYKLCRNYVCQFPGCEKAYVYDLSLAQHIKTKHPESYESKVIIKFDSAKEPLSDARDRKKDAYHEIYFEDYELDTSDRNVFRTTKGK